ncbi:MAG: fabB [Myxococcaceae bacterium]|nr:fabB [Myxococcaceae bacterium]
MTGEAFVVGTGVICSIGNSAAQCSASFRAGLSGYALSSVQGRTHEDLRLALVPELDLEPLSPALESESLSCRERRMLRLGGEALRSLENLTGPLFLALPEPRPAVLGGLRVRDDFLALLGAQAEVHFDPRTSKTFALGRAGGFFALQAGLAALRAGAPQVLVGGIETCLDLRLLSWLETERRLLADGVRDGFTPGEAAAFLCLSARRSTASDAVIRAVGTAEDPGHRYSEEPALGSGLSAALDAMQWRSQRLPPVRTCFAGLNGESFGAKAWGWRTCDITRCSSPSSRSSTRQTSMETWARRRPRCCSRWPTRRSGTRSGPHPRWSGQHRTTPRAAPPISRTRSELSGTERVRYVRATAQTVFANTRGVTHKQSNGISTVFPDVCKTPMPSGPPVPMPSRASASSCSTPST